MIIEDIDYIEMEECSEIEGGRRHHRHRNSIDRNALLSLFQPILQSFNINPSTSINFGNIGNNSTVNTAISTNISVTPIFIVINPSGNTPLQLF